MRQEKLQDLFGELVQAIHIDGDKVEWVKEALKASHQDEKEFHNQANTSIADPICASPKIELITRIPIKSMGPLQRIFGGLKPQDWKQEQEGLRREIGKYEQANSAYFEEGVKILELGESCLFTIHSAISP